MADDFERALQFVRHQREELIVRSLVLVGGDHNPEISFAGHACDEWQQASVQVPQRTVAELDVHDSG